MKTIRNTNYSQIFNSTIYSELCISMDHLENIKMKLQRENAQDFIFFKIFNINIYIICISE